MGGQDEYIAVQEAARRMKISEETVLRSLEEGIIEGQKGETWHVSESAVKMHESDRGLIRNLPLTTNDLQCADCGEPLVRCQCK